MHPRISPLPSLLWVMSLAVAASYSWARLTSGLWQHHFQHRCSPGPGWEQRPTAAGLEVAPVSPRGPFSFSPTSNTCTTFLAWALSSCLHPSGFLFVTYMGCAIFSFSCLLRRCKMPLHFSQAILPFWGPASPELQPLFWIPRQRFLYKARRAVELGPKFYAANSLLPSRIPKKPRDTSARTKGHCSF